MTSRCVFFRPVRATLQPQPGSVAPAIVLPLRSDPWSYLHRPKNLVEGPGAPVAA